ncbi:outer membrane protein [Aliiroseovarius halocynthiae]|uniref:TolC family outer membrane protein n=1 Tax=Aliiroseovarius halocynthiae TaxID=985055 RepID=A0A545SMT9_9RHOB|nr:TolC family outer membrane protein [Aliiroseovarius halocynthiae]TQV66267.1 TolC family outer membrane protein [Aliiroseovarius halocynthiae]SMR82611.1 outer membrane protein [Aliiroseovarius halocynthiae]
MRIGFKSKLMGMAAACALVTAPTAFAESLSDAMASAYKNSGLLEQNRATLRAADEDVAIARSALRPTLTYALSQSFADRDTTAPNSAGWSTSASLTANILIFDFGRSKKAIELQKQLVLATHDSLVGVEQQVLLRAVQAYLNVRSAVENAQLQSNSVRVLTQELRAANDRFEVGEVTQTDVALARARLAAARANEASARGNLEIAREEYKAVTGGYPHTLTAPPAPPMTAKTVEAAQAIARDRHPEILAAQHNVTAADLGVAISKDGMKPSISGQAQSSWGRRPASGSTNQIMVDGFEHSVGVTLQGTIYAGGRLSAEYRKAIAQSEAARAGLHQTRIAVDQGVANAWAQLAIASASLQATDRQIRASRVALRGAREEASLGSRTTLDVLNAEQELLNAEAARITAQSNQYLAVYSLLSAMGLLTAEHLNLGVVTYDPEAYYNAVQSAPIRQVSPQGERLDLVLEALGKK